MRMAHRAGMTLGETAKWIGCSYSVVQYRERELGIRFLRRRFWRPDPAAPVNLAELMAALVKAAGRRVHE